MKTNAIWILCLVLLLGAASFCHAQMQAAGIVKSVNGNALIVRNGQTSTAENGTKIMKGDIIKTHTASSIGLIFNDDTVVSMGPTSEMIIDEFYFVPIEGKLSFIVRFIRGTVSYLSGQIAKLAPQAVRLETPAATIGVRGTQVLIKLD